MTTGLPEKAGLQVETEAWENSTAPAGRTFQAHRRGNLQGTAGPLDTWTAVQPAQPAHPRGPCREQQEGSHSLAPASLLPGTLRASCRDRNVSETVCPQEETGRQRAMDLIHWDKKKKNQMPRRRVRRGKNPNCCRIMQLKFHA